MNWRKRKRTRKNGGKGETTEKEQQWAPNSVNGEKKMKVYSKETDRRKI